MFLLKIHISQTRHKSVPQLQVTCDLVHNFFSCTKRNVIQETKIIIRSKYCSSNKYRLSTGIIKQCGIGYSYKLPIDNENEVIIFGKVVYLQF